MGNNNLENRILDFQHFVSERLHDIDDQLSVVAEE